MLRLFTVRERRGRQDGNQPVQRGILHIVSIEWLSHDQFIIYGFSPEALFTFFFIVVGDLGLNSDFVRGIEQVGNDITLILIKLHLLKLPLNSTQRK